MNELIGVKWADLKEETKEHLLQNAFYEGIGDVIFDLTNTLSVSGNVDIENDEVVLKVDDNAIIYSPTDGIIEIAKDNVSFEIDDVLTLAEAAEMWGVVEGTIRASIRTNKLIIGVDYRKAGRITLITQKAMERVYGKL